jgi:hypothetical protein
LTKATIAVLPSIAKIVGLGKDVSKFRLVVGVGVVVPMVACGDISGEAVGDTTADFGCEKNQYPPPAIPAVTSNDNTKTVVSLPCDMLMFLNISAILA